MVPRRIGHIKLSWLRRASHSELPHSIASDFQDVRNLATAILMVLGCQSDAMTLGDIFFYFRYKDPLIIGSRLAKAHWQGLSRQVVEKEVLLPLIAGFYSVYGGCYSFPPSITINPRNNHSKHSD